MTRHVESKLSRELSLFKEVARAGHLITNVHSEGPNRPEDMPNARVLMDLTNKRRSL